MAEPTLADLAAEYIRHAQRWESHPIPGSPEVCLRWAADWRALADLVDFAASRPTFSAGAADELIAAARRLAAHLAVPRAT